MIVPSKTSIMASPSKVSTVRPPSSVMRALILSVLCDVIAVCRGCLQRFRIARMAGPLPVAGVVEVEGIISAVAFHAPLVDKLVAGTAKDVGTGTTGLRACISEVDAFT